MLVTNSIFKFKFKAHIQNYFKFKPHPWDVRKQPLDGILTSSVDTQMLLKMKDVDMLSSINMYDQSKEIFKKLGYFINQQIVGAY